MHVPDDFSVFQDGEEVQVDRSTQTARINLNASSDKFSLLWAYRKLDVPLVGKCVSLHWQVSPPDATATLFLKMTHLLPP